MTGWLGWFNPHIETFLYPYFTMLTDIFGWIATGSLFASEGPVVYPKGPPGFLRAAAIHKLDPGLEIRKSDIMVTGEPIY